MRRLLSVGVALAALATIVILLLPGSAPQPVKVAGPLGGGASYSGKYGCPVIGASRFGACGLSLPPVNNTVPVVSGSTVQGQTLSTSNGTWQGGEFAPASFTYQWQDCSGSCSNIVGATTNAYVLQASDVGDTVDVIVTAVNPAGSAGATSAQTATVVATGGSTFPLAVSANGRFLQTASGSPFLMVGDAPQSLIGNLTQTSAASYFTDRVAHGFNTLWINLLCDSYTFCNANGTAVGDGGGAISPFTVGSSPTNYNLADPNAAYFSRAHAILAAAQSDGLEVFLDPIETGGCMSGGWLTTLTANGATADFNFGVFLGNTFKDLHNITWMSGNDFQCFGTAVDDNVVQQVALGIASVNPTALQTLELSFDNSSSLDDTTHNWTGLLDLNADYTYPVIYQQILHGYNQTPTLPNFLVEANYEGEDVGIGDGGTIPNLRLQSWWTMTSGATGEIYGCGCTDGITNSWTPASIDTVGATQLGFQTTMLQGLGEWYNLVPDQSHTLVTSFGTCPTSGSIDGVNCVTAAETPDQTLALAYTPLGTSPVVNLAQMAGPATARWFDPTNGHFTAICSPSATSCGSGSHTFATPGTNSGGNSDWVLVLQAAGSGTTPSNTTQPFFAASTISGSACTAGCAIQGQTLIATPGTWTCSGGCGTLTFNYAWERCTTTPGTPGALSDATGANGHRMTLPTTASCSSPVQTGSSTTYTLGAGDVGKSIAVVVTATNSGTAGTPTSIAGSCNTGLPGTQTWISAEGHVASTANGIAGCSPISAVVGTAQDGTGTAGEHFCSNAPTTCGFADIASTGPPAGTTLLSVPGTCTSPAGPGAGCNTTGSGWAYSAGTINVSAGGVLQNVSFVSPNDTQSTANGTSVGAVIGVGTGSTVQDSDITVYGQNSYAVQPSASNVVITHNNIHGLSGANWSGCDSAARASSTQPTNFTFTNNNVWYCSNPVNNFEQGGLIGGNYMHSLGWSDGDDTVCTNPCSPNHHEDIQMEGGGSGTPTMTISNNTMYNEFDNETAATILSNDDAVKLNDHRTLNHNLMAGGGYSFYACGCAANSTNLTLSNNHFAPLFLDISGGYGPTTNWSASTNTWTNNVWDDTGAQLPVN